MTPEILLFGGFVVAIATISFLDRKMMKTAWRGASSRLGLVLNEGDWGSYPSMRGHHLGVQVLVDVEVRGHGKHRRYYTCYRAWFSRSLDLGLRIGKEGLLGSMSKFFGGQDIQLGDPEADQSLLIKGNDEHAVRAFLDRDRRVAAVMMVRRFPAGEIDDDGLKLVVSGVTKKEESLVSYLDDLVKATLAFEARS